MFARERCGSLERVAGLSLISNPRKRTFVNNILGCSTHPRLSYY
nr:MAG TPA: hypothetical protein [Caudoviricetes sp.]